MGTWKTRGLRGSTLEDLINRTNDSYREKKLTIKLNPGERKEVTKENAEAETPSLPNGDLYPAGIIE